MKQISKFFVIFSSILLLLYISAIKVYPGWFKHYGGSDDEIAFSIQQTSDEGYIVAGRTESYSYGSTDFAIYKLNNSGDKIWFKHYGGTSFDEAWSIQQTTDGGYVVAGYTDSYTYGSADFAIYKLNSSGNKVWFKHYGGIGDDCGFSIKQTSDGGYVVAGYTGSFAHGCTDFAIYKLNSSGDKIWFKHYGGISYDYGRSIQQTSDGGYVVAGGIQSFGYGGADFAIYKLDSSGNKVWFKNYGGTQQDWCWSIQQTTDGGYIMAGYTESYTKGLEDFAIYKLNSSGNKVWFKHYGGINDDAAMSIQQTTDGGYVVAGNTASFTYGGDDFAIYRLDSNGGKVWFKHYGGTNKDRGRSVQETSDGSFIIGGYTESYTYGGQDFAIYKLDSNGDK